MDRLSRSSGKALTFHGQDIDKSRPMVYKLLTPKMEAANGPTTRTRPDYRSNLQASPERRWHLACPESDKPPGARLHRQLASEDLHLPRPCRRRVHLQALPRRLDCPPARRSS